MPTIAILNQRHPSCDTEHVTDLRALYEGGRCFKDRLPRFLLRREREPHSRYELRKREYHYRNYLGPVIDYFTAMLFASRPRAIPKSEQGEDTDPGEFYDSFREDCDRNGSDIDAVFKDRLTEAMVAGCSWLRVHEPGDAGTAPATRLEFDERKLGECWVESLEYDSVLDWEVDDSGRLEFAVLHKCTAKRDGVNGSRDMVTETWEVLTPSDVAVYSITYNKSKPPADNEEVPLVGTVSHRFGRVPLVPMELPVGLWVANRLETPQLGHFRSSNGQSWSLSSTCYAMPVAKVADPEEFAKTVVGAGYGIVIGVEEDWTWEAPPNGHFAALDTEIKAHKDEIFRMAHQMALGVENNSAAVGRSADSKIADMEATRVVLLAYSRLVKEAIEYTYDLISAQRGDKFDWSIEGLDDFAAVDVMGLAEVLEKVDAVGGIPSKTWNIAVKSRLAEAILPDMDQAQKQKVRTEIEEGTPDPVEEHEAEQKRLDNESKAKSFIPPQKKQPQPVS